MRSDVGADPEVRFATFERRWDLAWTLIPYLLLAAATIIAVLTGGAAAAVWPILLGLTAVTAGWHAWFVTLHPHWLERRLVPMALYFAGLLVLSVILATRHEAYLLAVAGCFVMAFVALPGAWSYPAVALTGSSLLALAGGPGTPPNLAIQIVAGTLVAAAIGAAIRWVEREAGLRREAHAELNDAHGQLRTAHQELLRLSAEKRRLDAELILAAEQAGVARERARLARDIHDTHAQHLIGIGAQLEAAAEQLAPDHPVTPRLQAALELSRTGLVDARRAVNALRPVELDQRDLPDAVRAVVASWRRFHRIPVQVTIVGAALEQPRSVEEAVVRIIGEALANVARHASASRVDVTLGFVDDVLAVDIRDDGIGFDPDAPARGSGGYGIPAMRERVAEAGGELAVESSPGAGTVIAATIPVVPYDREEPRE
jgi:signal transduction histidine kinase